MALVDDVLVQTNGRVPEGGKEKNKETFKIFANNVLIDTLTFVGH